MPLSRSFRLLIATAGLLLPALHAGAQAVPAHQSNSPWFTNDTRSIEERLDSSDAAARARNLVLFIGDGMGIPTLTATRILAGQRVGLSGEEFRLIFEQFPYSATVKTYAVDAQVADSASAMTALMSGVKTNEGVLGANGDVQRGRCDSLDGNELMSLLELAEVRGLATGLVTTARITDATPAASYAKSPERRWEDPSEMPEEAIRAGCVDIALQLIDAEARIETAYGIDIDGLDVIMGGGRRHFRPPTSMDDGADGEPTTASAGPDATTAGGQRTDGRDLIAQWRQQYPSGRYLQTLAEFEALDASRRSPVLALLGDSHLHFVLDRQRQSIAEPSLSAMTRKSLALLSGRDTGFVLIVESARIEHAHQIGNAAAALEETLALADAVQVAAEMTDERDTLILVTADHSHGLSLGGNPKRGNPILGKVIPSGFDTESLDAEGLPFTTLGYRNGRGFADPRDAADLDAASERPIRTGRVSLDNIDTRSPGFHQEALVPLSSATRGGEDVSAHARGPGASRLTGVIEQNVLFHVMADALGLLDKPPSATLGGNVR